VDFIQKGSFIIVPYKFCAAYSISYTRFISGYSQQKWFYNISLGRKKRNCNDPKQQYHDLCQL